MTVPEIFARYGEAAFRDGERRVIARPSGRRADGPRHRRRGLHGAGDPRRDQRGGAAIWLHADLETLVQRTARRKHRPLLNAGEPRAILAELMAARYPLYAGAEIRVESTNAGRAEDVARDALDAILAYDATRPPALRLMETRP